MKIEEAIAELQKAVRAAPHETLSSLPLAMQLGIEALKRVKWLTATHQYLGNPLLPGETHDNGGS